MRTFIASKARIALLPLLVSLGAASAAAPWHSNVGVDARSYFEMIDGISRHGLPIVDNGPVGTFGILQARWNQTRDGTLWGTYPPVYPYFAVVPYRLGGIRLVIRANFLLLAILALGIFRLGSAVSDSEWIGTAAAYTTFLCTPIWGSSFDISPYTICIALMVWAACAIAVALRSSGRRRLRASALAGLLGGLSVGAQLSVVPMLAALVLILFVVAPTESASPADSRRQRLTAGLTALLAAAAALAPVAVLNRVRFASWNPISYGPCVWRSCAETSLDKQSVVQLVAYAFPVFAFAAVSIAAIWPARRSRHLPALLALVVAIFAWSTGLHERSLRLAALTWGFVGDSSGLELQGFVRRDGLGNFLGPYVVKAMLQGSPLLVLAFAPRCSRARNARDAMLLLLLPPALLLLSLALRAPMSYSYALGFPFLHERYLFAALPFFVVAFVVVVRDLPWTDRHAYVVAAVTMLVAGWLARADNDFALPRRLLLLRGSLCLASAAVFAVAWWRRRPSRRAAALAAAAVCLVVSYSAAVSVGVDLAALIRGRRFDDRAVDAVARLTPHRFALIGWPPEIDRVLSLRARRDLEYADLYEVTDWNDVHQLLSRWNAENRPVYALMPGFGTPPPGFRNVALDRALGLFRIMP